MSILHQVATLGPGGHLSRSRHLGSVAAIILACLIVYRQHTSVFTRMLVWIIGHQATTVYVRDTGRHDPSELVIDEVVGQWIGLLPVVLTTTDIFAAFLMAFLLFAALTSSSPGPLPGSINPFREQRVSCG